MTSSTKSNPDVPGSNASAGSPEAAPAVSPLTEMVQKGAEGILNVQKSALEIAAQQQAAAINILKEGLKVAGSVPMAAIGVVSALEQGIEAIAAAQKTVIEFAAKQNAQLVRQGVDGYVELQKKVLDLNAWLPKG